MTLFEVRLVPRITSGAACLLKKEDNSYPVFLLKENVSWKEAIANFIRKTLGDEIEQSNLRFRLVEVKSKKGRPPVLVIYLECNLKARRPPAPGDDRYHWVKQKDTLKAQRTGRVRKKGKLDPELEVELYTDGASRRNPGPAGVGVLLQQKKAGYEEEYCRFIGEATNNVAEYTALVDGLVLAVERGARRVVHRADSELLVKQLEGEYKVKSDTLKVLLYRARDIIATLEAFSTEHIGRENNTRADALSKRAIDEAEGEREKKKPISN